MRTATKNSRKRTARMWYYHRIEGWTFAELSDEFEVTRQRAHQLVKRLDKILQRRLAQAGWKPGQPLSDATLLRVNALLYTYEDMGEV